ncbi:hypothetical protein M3Y97_00837000 [Aphelenchoides bicaudatus]|nr:hypothetical protein M3Y97_00837000 [Aphelenchoides bicaudatus]
MQIISDALVEEPKKHASNQPANNNSIPSSLGVDTVDHAPQNIIKRHPFTNAVPKPAATAPLLSTPENRSVNLAYSNGGSLKNGRKRTIKDQVIVLENLNLDSITQSSSSAPIFPKKAISPRKITMPINTRPIFQKAPLQVSIDKTPQTTTSEPFSSDSYLSQQQECSSNHSDDNSILSPVEATECIRAIYNASNKSDSWPSWSGAESKSPRTDIKDDKLLTFSDSGQTKTSLHNGDVASTPASAVDPHDINLNENEFEQKKPIKASATKDPESGLTIDTVKRRRLCSRYDHMLAEHGVVHRLVEVPHLTSIQVAGLLRRSRNRQEMTDLSEDVWNFVFEEKRRVEERAFCEVLTGKELSKKLSTMKNEDLDEATDTSDVEDGDLDFENGFPFEEVQNLAEEDRNVHELLKSECEYYEMRRYYFEMDRWLCLLKRSLMERRSKARQIAEMISKKPTLQFIVPPFAENEDTSQRCARCMPVKVLNRSKFVKQPPHDRRTDSFNFIKQSEHLLNLDTDLSRCLEDLSLQLQDEDFNVLTKLSKPISRSEPRMTIENISEIRRREARDRAKKASERLKNNNHRGVGRPPKDRTISKAEANRKYLKRKASRDHRERLNSSEVTILQENPADLKSFEEQLRRLSNSKAYVYSEILIPDFRVFDLDDYAEKANEKLIRKVSNDLVESQMEVAGPSTESVDILDDPLYFARIHHECEFPQLSEEEIRRRRKERWPIPVHQPFDAEAYAHEDSRKVALMYCVTNEKSHSFAPRFHPGIVTQPCVDIHREPKVQSMNKYLRNKPAQTPNSNHSQELMKFL